MIYVKALSADSPLYRLDFRWGLYDVELHQAVAFFYDEGPARVSAVVLSALGPNIHPDQVKAVGARFGLADSSVECPECGGPMVAYDHPDGSWACCSECGFRFDY